MLRCARAKVLINHGGQYRLAKPRSLCRQQQQSRWVEQKMLTVHLCTRCNIASKHLLSTSSNKSQPPAKSSKNTKTKKKKKTGKIQNNSINAHSVGTQFSILRLYVYFAIFKWKFVVKFGSQYAKVAHYARGW